MTAQVHIRKLWLKAEREKEETRNRRKSTKIVLKQFANCADKSQLINHAG